MGLTVDLGAAAPLSLQLPDGATTKSVVATIVTLDGTPVEEVSLTHRVNGLYTGSFVPGSLGELFAQFVVYTDNTKTNLDMLYSVRMEDYRVVPPTVPIDADVVAGAVWDAAVSDHNQLNSFGQYIQNIEQLQSDSYEAITSLANYRVRMSTSYDPVAKVQEVITWAEKNGLRTVGSNCLISVRKSTGEEVWSANLNTPNEDGVFRFVSGFNEGTDKTFYVVIGINVDGVTRVGQEPFFTVG